MIHIFEFRIKILELKVPTSSLIRIFPKEKEKKTTYKSRKKRKKESPIFRDEEWACQGF
jgi:hypothetical protein